MGLALHEQYTVSAPVLKDLDMTDESIDRLIHSLEERFVSWKSIFLYVLPMYMVALTVPIGVSMWLINDHASKPLHSGAVSQQEFRLVMDRLDDIQEEVRDLRRLVNGEAE